MCQPAILSIALGQSKPNKNSPHWAILDVQSKSHRGHFSSPTNHQKRKLTMELISSPSIQAKAARRQLRRVPLVRQQHRPSAMPRVRSWGLGLVLFMVAALLDASLAKSKDCYTGMREADVDGSNGLGWDEYKVMIETFGRLNFANCSTTAPDDEQSFHSMFMQSACSCLNYQVYDNVTAINYPPCTCSMVNASVVIPGIYREPYNSFVCESIEEMLENVCNDVTLFQPKPLRPANDDDGDAAIGAPVTARPNLRPSSNTTIAPSAAPTSTATSTAAPSAQHTPAATQRRGPRMVPLLASTAAVGLYILAMIALFCSQVRHLNASHEKFRQVDTVAEPYEHDPDDDDRTNIEDNQYHEIQLEANTSPRRIQVDNLATTAAVTNAPWSLSSGLADIYLIEEDDDDENNLMLNSPNAASSLPQLVLSPAHSIKSGSSRQIHLNDAVDSIVSPYSGSAKSAASLARNQSSPYHINDAIDSLVHMNHPSTSSSWLVKSFDKHHLNSAPLTSSSVNYNDVSAPTYYAEHDNGSDTLYRTDIHEYSEPEKDSYFGTSADVDDGDSSDPVGVYDDDLDVDGDDYDDQFSGPIDIDDGEAVPAKRQSKVLLSNQRQKPKMYAKVRSVKGARAAYMKQAQERSNNSLKPIPEATLTKAKPFVI
jgi:hypothetical protein